MAFEINLVAISWRKNIYTVVSQVTAAVDTGALKRDGLLHDVSHNAGYVDEAALIEKSDLEKYFLPAESGWARQAQDWYSSLPTEATFILVHLWEWESGLD
jgi:hypothetical protein